jgi:hypothetical protein
MLQSRYKVKIVLEKFRADSGKFNYPLPSRNIMVKEHRTSFCVLYFMEGKHYPLSQGIICIKGVREKSGRRIIWAQESINHRKRKRTE